MTRYWGLWWGGNGYSPPCPDEDLEEFVSLGEVKAKLLARYEDGYWRCSEFRFVHRDAASALCPCVSEDTEILLFTTPDGSDYPDLRVFLGARCRSARVERC